MALTAPPMYENRWDPPPSLSDLDALVYRSNLLASDRSIVNFGGGNTSVKTREIDHAGRETTVLWVKGSGTDLATITAGGFTGLRLDEILPLVERDAMTDEEMVAYLARCQIDPSMPRPSIETLLHAFVPHPHVDHTHPDAIGAIVGTVDGEQPCARMLRRTTRFGSRTSVPASHSRSSSQRRSRCIRGQRLSCSRSTAS